MARHLLTPAVAASLLLGASWANATPNLEMRITQNANSITVLDPGHAGIVDFQGTVGTFKVADATGLGEPQISQPLGYQIDLSGALVAKKPGTITLALTETNLLRPMGPLGIEQAFAGTLPAMWTITFDSYLDTSNAAFGKAKSLYSYSFTAPKATNSTAFSVDASEVGIVGAGLFSITDIVTITATTIGHPVSFDATTTDSPVPEPAAIAVLGLGILGLGLARRRDRAASA